jgi:uncharacterized protein (TIGR03435 family)
MPNWEGVVCGARSGSRDGQSFVWLNAQPIELLADLLARRLSQPIIDRTGLTGIFDIELSYSPERRGLAAASDRPFEGTVSSIPSGPSLEEALKDQLGLRLERAQGPVEFLVIESVQRPTPD